MQPKSNLTEFHCSDLTFRDGGLFNYNVAYASVIPSTDGSTFYVIGGTDGENMSDRVVQYLPDNDFFTLTDHVLETGRAYHTAVRVLNPPQNLCA